MNEQQVLATLRRSQAALRTRGIAPRYGLGGARSGSEVALGHRFSSNLRN